LIRVYVEWILARRGYTLMPHGQAGEGYPASLSDVAQPLPPSAAEELRGDNPRLQALRRIYGELGWPVCGQTRWQREALNQWLDLRYFRGDNAYVWHYREARPVTELKYFIFLQYVQQSDRGSLLKELGEDGLFGCWTHRFAGHPACSRDLLDSVNELGFLRRNLTAFSEPRLRVIDIGAGYGRLAYRTAQALPGLQDYCCVDAVAESTFLCEFYSRFRGVSPPVRVVPLNEVPGLERGSFDLAVNVHSFSECNLAAIEWWLDQVVRLRVPHLFVVPNEPAGYLSTESDGSRTDYLPAIESAGYRLAAEEPVFLDAAVRELLGVADRFCLFELPS
jgi:SAM-dependent methyltransferase